MTMINTISEGPARAAAKVDPVDAIHERQVVQQQSERLREARSVVKADGGNQTMGRDREKEESRYVVEDRKVVFEKYDKNGDLVLRIPSSHKPVSQRV
jgi:hypothetical protein